MIDLYGHPFSSYTWKALIALYANATPFAFRVLDPDHPENGAMLARHSPTSKFPLLVEGDRVVFEASTIIDYLDAHHSGPIRFVPTDPDAGIAVRMMDRVFDHYVMAPMQGIVADAPARRQSATPPPSREHVATSTASTPGSIRA